jgi:hypothetical protein
VAVGISKGFLLVLAFVAGAIAVVDSPVIAGVHVHFISVGTPSFLHSNIKRLSNFYCRTDLLSVIELA